MQKVLVTGASGFIGSGLIESLVEKNKYSIYGTTTHRRNLEQYSHVINIEEVNLLNNNDIKNLIEKIKPDFIIHLAWKLEGNDSFQTSSENMEWLRASIFLIEQAVENNVKKFVFAGSSSEYNFSERPLIESDDMKCINLYGRCKKAVTDVCIDYCVNKNTDFVSARIFSVYGKYDNRTSRAIPEAIKKLCRNEKFYCNSPENKWDYIYISDAVNAIIKIMESDYKGIVNIGSGKVVTMREVFNIIGELMSKEDLIEFNSKFKEVGLVSDNKILENVIGYKCVVDIRSGLKETIKWFTRIYI